MLPQAGRVDRRRLDQLDLASTLPLKQTLAAYRHLPNAAMASLEAGDAIAIEAESLKRAVAPVIQPCD
jgi:hypothetical protein